MIENINYTQDNGILFVTFDEKIGDKVINHKEPFFVQENGKDIINPAVDKILTEDRKNQILDILAKAGKVQNKQTAQQPQQDPKKSDDTKKADDDSKTKNTAKKVFTLVKIAIAGLAIGFCFKACANKLENDKAKEATKSVDPQTTTEAQAQQTPAPKNTNSIADAMKGKTVFDEKALEEVLNNAYADLDSYGITKGMSEAEINAIKYDALCAAIVTNAGDLEKDLLTNLNLDNTTEMEKYKNAMEYRGYIYDYNYTQIGEENPKIFPMSNLVFAEDAKEVVKQAEKVAEEACKNKEGATEAVQTFTDYYSDLAPAKMNFEFKPANEFAMATSVEAATKAGEYYGLPAKTIDELRNKPGNKSYAWYLRVMEDYCKYDTNEKQNTK